MRNVNRTVRKYDITVTLIDPYANTMTDMPIQVYGKKNQKQLTEWVKMLMEGEGKEHYIIKEVKESDVLLTISEQQFIDIALHNTTDLMSYDNYEEDENE